MTLEEYKAIAEHLPDAPGVYFFLGAPARKGGKEPLLYIGKATSLRSRVRSYFTNDIVLKRSDLIARMVERAVHIEWRETDSVLDALILEAALIKEHQPPYNTDEKDNKTWNYVVVTAEDFPCVLLVRGRVLDGQVPERLRKHVFGPFPHGAQLKEAMRIIRKIFPFRDTCTPAAEAIAAGKKPKACFNRHIGLCPGVCTGEVGKTEYARTIRHLALLFSGKKGQLLTTLEKEMSAAAKQEDFERAAKLRGQLFALRHIRDVSLIKEESRAPYRTSASASLVPGVRANTRIEAYDVAHLRGKDSVGVMTVVEEGEANTNEYRLFTLRTAKPGDDPGALREILGRRLAHPEWRLPALIVVDGSTAQLNAAEATLRDAGVSIPVVGVVKDEHHRPREIRGVRAQFTGRERDILLANAEAHRFAISRHRSRSRKSFLK